MGTAHFLSAPGDWSPRHGNDPTLMAANQGPCPPTLEGARLPSCSGSAGSDSTPAPRDGAALLPNSSQDRGTNALTCLQAPGLGAQISQVHVGLPAVDDRIRVFASPLSCRPVSHGHLEGHRQLGARITGWGGQGRRLSSIGRERVEAVIQGTWASRRVARTFPPPPKDTNREQGQQRPSKGRPDSPGRKLTNLPSGVHRQAGWR